MALLEKLTTDGSVWKSVEDLSRQWQVERRFEPATPRQLAFLRHHDINDPMMTKREAGRQIGRIKSREVAA